MARPTTVKGSKLLIQIADGGSPVIYAAPCALTTKGINFTAETNDFNIPDCDNPDAPMWTERVASALSAGVTGSGTLAMEAFRLWDEWFRSGLEKDIRVVIDIAAGQNGGGYWSMSAILTGFNVTGNDGELVQVEVDIQSNGEVVWTDAV